MFARTSICRFSLEPIFAILTKYYLDLIIFLGRGIFFAINLESVPVILSQVFLSIGNFTAFHFDPNIFWY